MRHRDSEPGVLDKLFMKHNRISRDNEGGHGQQQQMRRCGLTGRISTSDSPSNAHHSAVRRDRLIQMEEAQRNG